MLVVIKIGGALIAKNFQNVIQDISNIYSNYGNKYTLIVVHGGGPQINETLKKMNKEPKYFKTPSGFTTRYTDQEAIEAAIMSLGGTNNKRLVEALQKYNINAFGFSGIDGGVIEAERKEIVNVDGDRAASFIAKALKADILISLTDVKGIYRDFNDKNSIIKNINSVQLEGLLDNLEGGMKKKAYAALEALKLDVKKVVICSGLTKSPIFDALENNLGTVITNE